MRSLYTTSKDTVEICPLANRLIQSGNLLKFDDEEYKTLNESKDDFATIAGVHR